MRKFIFSVFLFLFFIIGFIAIGLLLPTTPRASKSLLMASVEKDSLLIFTKSPRIIFVGGSNSSFGINSKMIKDSLNMNPINTGIHASIGLQYMLKNTLQYVKKGDVVVLIPEYSHFFNDYNCGSEELMRMVFDVNISKINNLNVYQLINIVPFIPKYALSKFNPMEYFNVSESDVYGVNSFNKYGDAIGHYGKVREKFTPYKKYINPYNPIVIKKIKEFQREVEKRDAILLVSYPAFQDISFLNCLDNIKRVNKEYEINKFSILGNPKKYMIPNTMMFNTPYHLSKLGVDYRTNLLIEDLKKNRLLY